MKIFSRISIILMLLIGFLMPSIGLAITQLRISQINQFMADLKRGRIKDADAIQKRANELKRGLSSRELDSPLLEQMNETVATTLEKIAPTEEESKEKPATPTKEISEEEVSLKALEESIRLFKEKLQNSIKRADLKVTQKDLDDLSTRLNDLKENLTSPSYDKQKNTKLYKNAEIGLKESENLIKQLSKKIEKKPVEEPKPVKEEGVGKEEEARIQEEQRKKAAEEDLEKQRQQSILNTIKKDINALEKSIANFNLVGPFDENALQTYLTHKQKLTDLTTTLEKVQKDPEYNSLKQQLKDLTTINRNAALIKHILVNTTAINTAISEANTIDQLTSQIDKINTLKDLVTKADLATEHVTGTINNLIKKAEDKISRLPAQKPKEQPKEAAKQFIQELTNLTQLIDIEFKKEDIPQFNESHLTDLNDFIMRFIENKSGITDKKAKEPIKNILMDNSNKLGLIKLRSDFNIKKLPSPELLAQINIKPLFSRLEKGQITLDKLDEFQKAVFSYMSIEATYMSLTDTPDIKETFCKIYLSNKKQWIKNLEVYRQSLQDLTNQLNDIETECKLSSQAPKEQAKLATDKVFQKLEADPYVNFVLKGTNVEPVIHIPQGQRLNIFNYKVDAIVNPANSQLMHTSGLAVEIQREAGNELKKWSESTIKDIGELATGTAIVSSSFNIAKQYPTKENPTIKYIIHVVGPKLKEGTKIPSEEEKANLNNAWQSALKAAVSWNDFMFTKGLGSRIDTIAFPSISTGPQFLFPLVPAAKVAAQAVAEFIQKFPNRLKKIYIIGLTSLDQEAYINAFTNLKNSDLSK